MLLNDNNLTCFSKLSILLTNQSVLNNSGRALTEECKAFCESLWKPMFSPPAEQHKHR